MELPLEEGSENLKGVPRGAERMGGTTCKGESYMCGRVRGAQTVKEGQPDHKEGRGSECILDSSL